MIRFEEHLKKGFVLLFSILFLFSLKAQNNKEDVKIQLDSANVKLSKKLDEEAKSILDSIANDPQLKIELDLFIYYQTLIGDYFLGSSKYQKAIKAYERLLNLNSDDLNKETTLKLAKAINDLGIAYMKLNLFDEARMAHFKSITLYDRFNDPQGGSYNYNNLAIIATSLKEVDSAIFYHKMSIEYALLAKDTLGVGFNHLNMAILFAENNEPVKSLDNFHTSLKVFEVMKNERMVNGVQRRLAAFYTRMKDFETAQTLLLKNLNYYRSRKSKNGIAGTHLVLAELLLKKKELDSAFYHIEEGLAIYLESGYQKGLAKSYNLKASYLQKMGDLESAIKNYEKSLSHTGDELKGMKMNSLNGIASIFLLNGEHREAISYAQKALSEGNYSASPGNMAHSYSVLNQGYKALNNFKESLRYLELINEEKEKMFGNERALEFARIEYKYQLDKERALQQTEQEKKELAFNQQIEKEKWIRYTLILISILISLISFFAYRAYKTKLESNIQLNVQNQKLKDLRKREQELSEESLASKERELATMAMTSLEKNSMLQELEQKVSFIENRMDEELKPSLKEMRKTITRSIDLDKSWDSFMHRFEDVHPRFFDKLKEDNPKLTINDLKLSAYVKIGMSNKEIANVSHITLGSVKSKINRLKKKLDLGAEDSVRDYMLRYA